jgi:hypothetical protein
VDDGTRTRDIRHHKPALYLLSYAHHGRRNGSGSLAQGRRTRSEEPGQEVRVESKASTTSAAAACACSDVGPGPGTKIARR